MTEKGNNKEISRRDLFAGAGILLGSTVIAACASNETSHSAPSSTPEDYEVPTPTPTPEIDSSPFEISEMIPKEQVVNVFTPPKRSELPGSAENKEDCDQRAQALISYLTNAINHYTNPGMFLDENKGEDVDNDMAYWGQRAFVSRKVEKFGQISVPINSYFEGIFRESTARPNERISSEMDRFYERLQKDLNYNTLRATQSGRYYEEQKPDAFGTTNNEEYRRLYELAPGYKISYSENYSGIAISFQTTSKSNAEGWDDDHNGREFGIECTLVPGISIKGDPKSHGDSDQLYIQKLMMIPPMGADFSD